LNYGCTDGQCLVFTTRCDNPYPYIFVPLSNESAQTIELDQRHAHRLASQVPTRDLWLKSTESRTFVIEGFIWITSY
jgi:hypothetical protein